MLKFFLLFCVFFGIYSSMYANIEELNLDLRAQRNFETVQTKLQNTGLYRQVFMYTNLKNYTTNYLQENTLNSDKKYLLERAITRLENKIQDIESIIRLSNNFDSHVSLPLVLSEYNASQIIQDNFSKIQSAQSIFIFRSGNNLSLENFKKNIQEIKNINPDTLIFIDQEGGLINRYQDFDTNYTLNNLLDSEFIQLRQQNLSDTNFQNFKNIFSNNYPYFPSLSQVSILYDSMNEESGKIMLEMFAYLRLKSHLDTGTNTYGLVADLSLGNPSITPLQRSFSQHTSKYILLLDAFAIASRETGVLVYLKHFPGVGIGYIDSHNGVLDLRNNPLQLQENIALFQHAKNAFGETPLGIMMGHVIVPESLKTEFTTVSSGFDFIITDDLGMQGYIGATGKQFTSGFFSIDQSQNSDNFIILDRGGSYYIK